MIPIHSNCSNQWQSIRLLSLQLMYFQHTKKYRSFICIILSPLWFFFCLETHEFSEENESDIQKDVQRNPLYMHLLTYKLWYYSSISLMLINRINCVHYEYTDIQHTKGTFRFLFNFILTIKKVHSVWSVLVGFQW